MRGIALGSSHSAPGVHHETMTIALVSFTRQHNVDQSPA